MTENLEGNEVLVERRLSIYLLVGVEFRRDCSRFSTGEPHEENAGGRRGVATSVLP